MGMALKKNERLAVFNKYGGKCAYCGEPLVKGWHVDHIKPIRRTMKQIWAYWKHEETGHQIEQSNFGAYRKLPTEEKNKYIFVPAKLVRDGMMHPELDVLSNKVPACQSCNINKHSMSVDEFRQQIEGFMKHLNEASTQYKIAKRYGLVVEHPKKVVFYFETFKQETPPA